MSSRAPLVCDLAVIGAGPAGLTAAIEASRTGARVALIDENARPGGQLFKQIHKFFGSEEHRAGVRGFRIGEDLLAEAQRLRIEVMLNTAVWGLFEGNEIGIVRADGVGVCKARRVIVATGATENPLAFPGWTLPGVMGAGAAQTMINVNRVLPGRRCLMVGTGNVGLIVAYQLLQAGAEVVALVEGLPYVGGYHVHAAKLRRAGVPIFTRHTVVRARGDDALQSATIAQVDQAWRVLPGTERDFDVDLIALAVGLRPQADLCWMMGCAFQHVPALGGHAPLHNEDMETTVAGVYVAGDISGIEEASTAMEEGRLAGVAAAESLGLVPASEAADLKQRAREALDALRAGSYGEMRRAAKRQLLDLWSAAHEGHH
jgi:thioredoxin reductase